MNNGGGLICSATPWGWLQLNPGKTLEDLSVFHFCNDIGIRLLDNYSDCPNPIPIRYELIQFKNIYHATERLAKNPTDSESIAIVGSACQHLGGNFSGLKVEILQDIVRKIPHDIIPYRTQPVKNSYRTLVAGLSGIMCSLSGIKAPGNFSLRNWYLYFDIFLFFAIGISNFPYDFEQMPPIENGVTCHIESTAGGWYCTGYYWIRYRI